jgi:ketosteroid isomerase-like protein
MNTSEQKERAIRFLENFNHPDQRVFEELITEDFRFKIVTGLPDFPPVQGRTAFASSEVQRLKSLFPNGLNMRLLTVICEGPHVAVQAECNTTAMNGRPYCQRYHFYLRFEGELITEGREYNDTNLIREVFLS